MELLIAWIITILISFGMELGFSFNVLKDLANNGYKLNYVKLVNANQNIDLESIKINKILLLIPFVNIFKEIERAYMYKEQRPYILDEFRVIDVLEEMTKEEMKEYEQNPTVSTAIKFIVDNAPIHTVKLNDNSIIYYYLTDENTVNKDNIVITKVKGPAKKLSEDEQKQEITKVIHQEVNDILSKFVEFEEKFKNINNKDTTNDVLVDSTHLEKTQYTLEENNCNNEEKTKILTKKINRK